MERSSRTFLAVGGGGGGGGGEGGGGGNRKFYAKSASPIRYFTENSRWVPLYCGCHLQTKQINRQQN